MSPGRAEIAVHACRRGERPCSVAAGAREAAEWGEPGGWRDERDVGVWFALLEGCSGGSREDGFGKEERLG